MIGIIFLLIVAQVAFATKVEEVQKRFNRVHTFPDVLPSGKQSVNEYQFVNPEHIQKYNLRDDQSYSFTEIDPLFINARDMVTVSFKSSIPSTKDWIGAYSPANVDITTTVPVKYGWCDDDLNYMNTGMGTLTFNFTNLRADIAFYYFTNSTAHPILVSTGNTVQFNNNNEPGKPRVVATGDYDVFNLLWSSATSKTPTLKWGTKSGVYDKVVSAVTTTIPKSSLCGTPSTGVGWRDLGLIHTAPLVGMKALATQNFYYVFGDEETNDFSREYVFHVPPLPGQQPADRGTRVILYDDLGRGSNDMTYTWYEYGRPAYDTVKSVGAEVAAGKVDAIYHGGDVSYAVGYLAVWDFFLEMLSPVASGSLYLSTVGNHESDWYNSASFYNNSDSGGECGVLTTRLIPLPAPATTDKPWYSYDTGLFHFIGTSTEHDIQIGSEQYQWLAKDLASVDRTVTPWIIFSGHRAMYINSDYGGSGNPSTDIDFMNLFVKNVEPLLFQYRVNLGFYGHNHAVQRHSAVYNFTTVQKAADVDDGKGGVIHYHDNPQATVHWIIGTGGGTFTKNSVTPGPDWSEETFYVYGYARMEAVNATYLDWEWVEGSTGKVLSHMVITQDDATKPWKL
jgi:hypothetical protein